MAKVYIFVATFTALNLAWVSTTFFTAIEHMEPLFKTHQSVIDAIEKYVTMETDKIEVLNKYLSRYKREHKKMQEEVDYFKNPINAYTLIKRLTTDLEYIEYYVKIQPAFKKKAHVLYPDDNDLYGAASGLWRLHRVYKLNISMLAAGRLEGEYSYGKKFYKENTSPMSVSDCYEVGRASYENEDFRNTVAWMHEALNKYHNNDPEEPFRFDVSLINPYLTDATIGLLEEYYQMPAEESDGQVPFIEDDDPDHDLYFFTPPKRKLYEALCRGDIPIPESERKRLFCYYKSNSDFLRLAPIKVEVLHQETDVYLFHDVTSDAVTQHLKQLALPKLDSATIREDGTSEKEKNYRISKIAWLRDYDSTVVARLSRLTEDLSGLSIRSAEALQVVHYGVGGQFDPHFDFFLEDRVAKSYSGRGNRIATIIFYMSDVEQGGATVFSDLNVTVFPIKNSAIMWMNLLPSGEPDYRTNHASCPVLRGLKWVSVQWLHAFGQEFKRPCNLEFEENLSTYIP